MGIWLVFIVPLQYVVYTIHFKRKKQPAAVIYPPKVYPGANRKPAGLPTIDLDSMFGIQNH